MLRSSLRSLLLGVALIATLTSVACSPDTFSPDTTGITFCSVLPFLCKNDDYQPDQPIYYSHKIHAGDNQIPCQYCHSGARRSDHAVIPSTDRCMGCHKFINATSPDVQKYQGEIDKLRDYAAKGEPIPWIKVHDLQDHVRFSHEPHIQGGVACQDCHGAVETFDTGKRLGWDEELSQAPLSMGWCVQCHTVSAPGVAEGNLAERGVSQDAADYHDQLKKETTTVLGNLKNCYTCHK